MEPTKELGLFVEVTKINIGDIVNIHDTLKSMFPTDKDAKYEVIGKEYLNEDTLLFKLKNTLKSHITIDVKIIAKYK